LSEACLIEKDFLPSARENFVNRLNEHQVRKRNENRQDELEGSTSPLICVETPCHVSREIYAVAVFHDRVHNHREPEGTQRE